MSHGTVMKHKGFYASVMEADRLKGDQIFDLPPGTALPVYPSEIFKEYPGSWMRGPGVFIIPVRPNKGIWFDWTSCDQNNTAIIPVVKGCNPITGMMCSGFHLERYDEKCPKHGCKFQVERFCPECGYKWPFGNYVAAPNTLWLDVWVNNGHGRQMYFTEDEVRDIATKMIGKENTVPAFGFAFYRPKVARPRQAPSFGGGLLYQFPHSGYKLYDDTPNHTLNYWAYTNSTQTSLGFSKGLSAGVKISGETQPDMFVLGDGAAGHMSADSEIHAYNCSSAPAAGAVPAPPPGEVKTSGRVGSPLRSMSVRRRVRVEEAAPPRKEVAVGAGARIRQDLVEDPYPLDTWKDKPDSVMTIYFVFKEQVDRMLEAGTVEVSEQPEGMLKGMPVG